MTERINLNTAHPDELTNLPGVGLAMADRIVAARPYQTPEDLLQVSGVGPALLERLMSLGTLEADETPEMEVPFDEDSGTQSEADAGIPEAESLPEVESAPPEAESQLEDESAPPEAEIQPEAESALSEAESQPEVESALSEAESQPDDEIIPSWDEGGPEDEVPLLDEEITDDADIIPTETDEMESTEEEKTPSRPRPVTQGQALIMVAFGSFTAFILALVFSLGIIASINGGLRFASPDQVAALDRQVDGLNSQVEILTQDIESLRLRITNLEGFSGRIGDLEAETKQLTVDMADTVDIVADMSAQIDDIFSQTARFQAFLNGLSELLNAASTP